MVGKTFKRLIAMSKSSNSFVKILYLFLFTLIFVLTLGGHYDWFEVPVWIMSSLLILGALVFFLKAFLSKKSEKEN
jgi:uncharacterized membrane protein YjdF